jgi:XrtN system VIT domain protein
MHLAYTEKTIEVHNHAKGWFRGQEEGIYTFHMPEGAVVTSLSLWVNGVEEKGILTTKEKATEAYRTIVGKEKRDPSVIHWQEGNTVSVRVFPVLPDESRLFRIGITAPLRKNEDILVYDNSWFFGPDPSGAEETVTVEMMSSTGSFAEHTSFQLDRDKTFRRKGKYKPRWSLQFEEQGLRPHRFSFDGHEYSLQPYNRVMESASIQNIYLDINEAWTLPEFKAVWEAVKDRNVYVFGSGLTLLTEDNHMSVFKEHSSWNFTLFPFHEITDIATSLVVSKSFAYSPNLDELEGSRFMQGLRNFAAQRRKVRFYNLGKELNCYLRSVKEFRLLQYDAGDVEVLSGLLRRNEFPKDQESDEQVVIHNAELAIVKKPGSSPSSGPDHLMRLFSYNHIMHRLGVDGFNSEFHNSHLVEEARKAYVVSPVSSLLVLETQEDYDRFDIRDAEKSLKNASMSSNGAVPEPHEWALIVMAAGVIFYLYIKSRY